MCVCVYKFESKTIKCVCVRDEEETESTGGSRRLVREPLLFLSFPLPFSFFAFWTTSLLHAKCLEEPQNGAQRMDVDVAAL